MAAETLTMMGIAVGIVKNMATALVNSTVMGTRTMIMNDLFWYLTDAVWIKYQFLETTFGDGYYYASGPGSSEGDGAYDYNYQEYP